MDNSFLNQKHSGQPGRQLNHAVNTIMCSSVMSHLSASCLSKYTHHKISRDILLSFYNIVEDTIYTFFAHLWMHISFDKQCSLLYFGLPAEIQNKFDSSCLTLELLRHLRKFTALQKAKRARYEERIVFNSFSQLKRLVCFPVAAFLADHPDLIPNHVNATAA